MGMFNPKNRKVITAIIAIILVLAMVVPTVLSLLMLLREVGRLLDETGYTVGNIDATVLCQAPKLAPHIPAMRQNIPNALGLALDDVSVKATTEEHLGFTGEGLGIAAHAVALIEKK